MFWGLVFVILVFTVTGFTLNHFNTNEYDVGEDVLRLMYEFDSFEELPGNYSRLRNICTPEVWDEISIEGDSRVISSYYKFQTSSSKVEIIERHEGMIVYRLINDYILPTRRFVFYYETSGGILISIREYELKGINWGKAGVLG